MQLQKISFKEAKQHVALTAPHLDVLINQKRQTIVLFYKGMEDILYVKGSQVIVVDDIENLTGFGLVNSIQNLNNIIMRADFDDYISLMNWASSEHLQDAEKVVNQDRILEFHQNASRTALLAASIYENLKLIQAEMRKFETTMV